MHSIGTMVVIIISKSGDNLLHFLPEVLFSLLKNKCKNGITFLEIFQRGNLN
jgi:hypothetical protein